MHIYVTRHGQPDLDRELWNDNPDIPLCDPVLTQKGRKQAKHLGLFLKKKGFKGLIISSPYRRTLETAQIIAEHTDSAISIEPAIQEVIYKEVSPDFVGMNIETIQMLYPNVSAKNNLPHPWFAKSPEKFEDVKERVKPFLESLKTGCQEQEILLVGHGASVHACKELLLEKAFDKNLPEKHNWNCSLSTYIFNEAGKLERYKLFNTDHMPENIITSNKREYCRELEYAI